MKVLVIGSGGREHTLIWKLAQSPKVTKIYAAPGNAGIGEIAENVNIKPDDIRMLLEFAKSEAIDLTVVGPEVPLVLGITDQFNEAGLRVFGPDQACAELEGSKAFAKDFMIRHKIPTAAYKEYHSAEAAYQDIGIYGFPMVIKADGLAAGKGVVIAQTEEEAQKALREIMEDRCFGDAGDKVVIEEFLEGVEASILCFVDGETILPMESAQDYKKAFDNDLGPNTGGMGTYSPSYVYDDKIRQEVEQNILTPFIEGLKADGLTYKGVIFIGVMLTSKGVKVIEFNVRFGDPETQVVIPRMESDLVDVMDAVIDGKLKDMTIKWSEEAAVCVVLASGGYPESYEKGYVINGLNQVDAAMVFHAGTRLDNQQVLTNGGRVLGVVAKGKSVDVARTKAYEALDQISFDKMHYRTDIGKPVTL